jgi:hypothetical protein
VLKIHQRHELEEELCAADGAYWVATKVTDDQTISAVGV